MNRIGAAFRSSWGWFLVTFLVANMMLGISAIGLYVTYHSPARTVISVHEVESVAVRGSTISLYSTVISKRDCPIQVDRWLWHWTGEPGKSAPEFVPLLFPAIPPLPVGAQNFVLTIPLPVGVQFARGEWFYGSRSWPQCGLWDQIVRGGYYDSASVPVPDITTTAERGDKSSLPSVQMP